MRQLVSDFGITFPVLIERDRKNFDNYKVTFIPTIVLIDGTGMIRRVGFMYGRPLEDRIVQLLEEEDGKSARTVDKMFQEVVDLVESGKSTGLIFINLAKELDEVELSGHENYNGGLLLHYGQRRERAIRALETFRREYPDEETPELIAALIFDYAISGQAQRAEDLDRYFRRKYPNCKEKYRFSNERLIDSINHGLLIAFSRSGQYEKALAKSKEMSRIRKTEKPEQYPTTSVFRIGTNTLLAMGRYDEAIAFVNDEKASFPAGSVFAEYAELEKLKAEYEKISREQGHGVALAHMRAARNEFQNKYALRKYEYELDNAGFVGEKMFDLSVGEWLQRDDSVEKLEGKVIILDLMTST
ncbi:MAG TPA: hypothetical protein VMX35_10460 [Acidobacteriota bacterium]|nr:hypothetical protein [Acidobacteriota bacterium]